MQASKSEGGAYFPNIDEERDIAHLFAANVKWASKMKKKDKVTAPSNRSPLHRSAVSRCRHANEIQHRAARRRHRRPPAYGGGGRISSRA